MPATDKENCVIDCRISSTKQQAGGSLGEQQRICTAFAQKQKLNILKVYSKVFSGRAEERDDFEEILGDIKAWQAKGIKTHYYVIKSIDRLTRDGAVTYDEMKGRLSHIGVQLLDANGTIQPERNTLEDLGLEYSWSKRSPTATAQLAEAQRAKDEVTDALTRMIGQAVRNVREGYKVRPPTDGFLNEEITVEAKKRTIEIPDPERAKYFIKLLELSAALTHSDEEIAKHLNAMGYRTKIQNLWDKNHEKIIGHRGGKPMTVKQLQAARKKVIYAGIKCEKWTLNKPVKAQYAGLVSIEKFNAANRGKVYIDYKSDADIRILYDQKPGKVIKRRLKNNPLFPYKFLLCHLCDKKKPFLGSNPTGNSGPAPTYHCARGHKYFGKNKSDFEAEIKKYIESLRFNADFMDTMEMTFLNKYRERAGEILQSAANMNRSVADLKIEQKAKLDALVAARSQVVREKLEAEVEALEVQIKEAEAERAKIEITETDIKAFIKEAKNVMEHPAEMLLDTTNTEVQQALFDLVFEGIPTFQEIANGTPKLAWIFKLSGDFARDKSASVRLWDVGWNTLESTVLKWNRVFQTINLTK